MAAAGDQVKPICRMKCPSLTWAMPPPAQCTIHASRMMARMISASHAKNSTIPGMAYPPMVLLLATAASYPPMPELFGRLTGPAAQGARRRRRRAIATPFRAGVAVPLVHWPLGAVLTPACRYTPDEGSTWPGIHGQRGQTFLKGLARVGTVRSCVRQHLQVHICR